MLFAAHGRPCGARSAKNLKWIQALGTGVDNIVDLPSLGKEVIVTNIRGIHGAPMSEATIAYMLSLSRNLPRSVHAQDRSTWERWPSQLMDGKTVGILGVGADRGISGADLQSLQHDGDRHHRHAAPRPGFDRMVARDDLVKSRPSSIIWWR